MARETSHPEQLVQSFMLGSKQTRSGQRRLELLYKVGRLGSLNAAAKACQMSYKGAWQAIDAMNLAAGEDLVRAQKGGAGGGGMVLTPAGEKLVAAYQLFSEQMQHWVRQLEELSPDMWGQLEIMRKVSMKTSARNLFNGVVTEIKKGEVNCEVILSVGKGSEVVAQITPESLERLELEVGSDAFALIKASWVILSEDLNGALKTSARNQFCGEIVAIDRGSVNADVTLGLENGNRISAIITNESLDRMELNPGDSACALIKASHVLLAVAD
ncbi:TOBE domain-containing protein [Thiomicrorhabdus sp.]|uniref:TOBE domain-containing protein n=1 Tax=Thiomicrorhabdus sp. TaxID=2039724 RepID=UPI0029C91F51|nr:TOBE domain-containing protein [Thiomicrorhabdus sp.]